MQRGDALYLSPASLIDEPIEIIKFIVTAIKSHPHPGSAGTYIFEIIVEAVETGTLIEVGDILSFYNTAEEKETIGGTPMYAPYIQILNNKSKKELVAEGLFERAFFFQSLQEAQNFAG